MYDEAYYRDRFGPKPYEREEAIWSSHFRTMAQRVVADLQPRRVLDVGCAKGFLVENLRDQGVEAFGLDGSSYAVSQARADVAPHVRVGDATVPFGEHYDLITCIEVAEHLPEAQAEALIRNLCAHTDQVLFSSTPEDFAEPTHFNVRPAEYWEALFARSSFFPDRTFDGSYVTRQAQLFRRVARPLKVAIFSREKAEWAVVRLRVLDPLRELERQGKAEVTFVSSYDEAIDVERLLGSDLFIVCREFADRAHSAELLEAAKTAGIPVVFELDDLLWKVPRSNPVWATCTRIAPDLMAAAGDADYLTLSTASLLDEIAELHPHARERSHVVKNCVNTEIWGDAFVAREPAPGEPLVFGWFGSPTHQEDLGLVADAIRYLATKHEGRVEFHFFGYMPRELKGVPHVRYVRGPQANVVKHAKGVREANLHAAIAPLTDHPFNHSKSDLKWLEYAICGLPGIYSDVTPYRASVAHGFTGLLAQNTTAGWVEAIERFVADAGLRARIARAAFDEVREHRCLDRQVWRWDHLYRSFVAGGRREKPAQMGDAELAAAAAHLFLFTGRQQARLGRLGAAEKSLEAALELDPSTAPRVARVAKAFLAQGRLAGAERLLVAAAERAAAEPKNFAALAGFYRAIGNPIDEEHVLGVAAQVHPEDPDLAARHVRLLASTSRPDEAASRAAAVAAAEDGVERVVRLVETLVEDGSAATAAAVVTAAAAAKPGPDWTPLSRSLEQVAARGDASSTGLSVAVLSALPPTSTRVHRRLGAPLRALQRLHGLRARWSDGLVGGPVLDDADVVLIHSSFLTSVHASGETDAPSELLAACASRGIPVAVDVDQPWTLDEAALARLDGADAIVVPNESARAALERVAPGLASRVRVIATQLDVDAWGAGRPFQEPEDRAFELGLFIGHVGADDLRALIRALGPLLREAKGAVTLSLWDPAAEPGSPAPQGRNVALSTPHHAEYVRLLRGRGPDLALVPVSAGGNRQAACEALFLELAACRIPVLGSNRPPFSGLIRPDQNGFLAAGAPAQLAERVRALVLGRDARRAVAERAWAEVLATRTVQARAGEWAALLDSLAAAAVAVR